MVGKNIGLILLLLFAVAPALEGESFDRVLPVLCVV